MGEGDASRVNYGDVKPCGCARGNRKQIDIIRAGRGVLKSSPDFVRQMQEWGGGEPLKILSRVRHDCYTPDRSEATVEAGPSFSPPDSHLGAMGRQETFWQSWKRSFLALGSQAWPGTLPRLPTTAGELPPWGAGSRSWPTEHQ